MQPMLDYLCWLESVLAARSVPPQCLEQSLDALAEFFEENMKPVNGAVVVASLQSTFSESMRWWR